MKSRVDSEEGRDRVSKKGRRDGGRKGEEGRGEGGMAEGARERGGERERRGEGGEEGVRKGGRKRGEKEGGRKGEEVREEGWGDESYHTCCFLTSTTGSTEHAVSWTASSHLRVEHHHFFRYIL